MRNDDWWADLPRDWFGDNPQMQDELAALVVSGHKSGSCCAAIYHDPAASAPGVRAVVENGAGVPVCVIEYTTVDFRTFDQIDAGWAAIEGEVDGSLDYWLTAHRGFFTREGSFAPDMRLACEQFRVIEVLSGVGS